MKLIKRTLITEREFKKLEELRHFFQENGILALKSVTFEKEPCDLDEPISATIEIKNYTQKHNAEVIDSALKIVRELLKF